MHSQKKSFSGGAMVEKNHYFSDPGPSNQSELLIHTVHLCVQYVHWLHPSIMIKKELKTDHAIHSQKISILGGAMVEKNHYFSDPGPSK